MRQHGRARVGAPNCPGHGRDRQARAGRPARDCIAVIPGLRPATLPQFSMRRTDSMVTVSVGTSSYMPFLPVFTAPIASTTSIPETTRPNTA